MAPVMLLRLSPAGSAPAITDQENVAVPPPTVRVALYGVPTCAPLSDVVVSVGGATTARVNVIDVFWPPPSTTVTPNKLVPSVVGTPETTPAELNDSPSGRRPPLSVHRNGAVPPEVMSGRLY